MKATRQLHDLGQSIWLDNITRNLLDSGTLQKYIDEFSVTGLTSNPTIFDQDIRNTSAYDAAMAESLARGASAEEVFFEVAIDDLSRAAKMLRPTYDRTNGVDGWVSLELSPLMARDPVSSMRAAKDLWARAGQPNLFIKIPGTQEGLQAIEESIFAGVPINVTLLFSREQYLAAADAYLKGVERRIAAGLNPAVTSVASLFISRWDVAVADKVPEKLRNTLGIAISKRAYAAYRELLNSSRWLRAANEGARAQKLLWASTGTKDPKASDTLYVESLTSPFTVNTMPDKTLLAFADHGRAGNPLPVDGGDCEEVLKEFSRAGIDANALATRLQEEGAESFSKSWNDLIGVIGSKASALKKAKAS